MNPQVIFSHGKESGPDGTKIRALTAVAEQRGLSTLSIDYTDLMDPDERVERLLRTSETEDFARPLVLAGSSMGAYVSLVAAATLRPNALFLMAPALYLSGWRVQDHTADIEHIHVVHGWADELIPADNALRYARQAQCALHLVDADHRLSGQVSLLESLFDAMLGRLIAEHTL